MVKVGIAPCGDAWINCHRDLVGRFPFKIGQCAVEPRCDVGRQEIGFVGDVAGQRGRRGYIGARVRQVAAFAAGCEWLMPVTISQNRAKPNHTHTSCGTSPVSGSFASAVAPAFVRLVGVLPVAPFPSNATNANVSTTIDDSHNQYAGQAGKFRQDKGDAAANHHGGDQEAFARGRDGPVIP